MCSLAAPSRLRGFCDVLPQCGSKRYRSFWSWTDEVKVCKSRHRKARSNPFPIGGLFVRNTLSLPLRIPIAESFADGTTSSFALGETHCSAPNPSVQAPLAAGWNTPTVLLYFMTSYDTISSGPPSPPAWSNEQCRHSFGPFSFNPVRSPGVVY